MTSRSWTRQALQAVIADLEGESMGNITLATAEDYKWRIEMIYRNLLAEDVLSGLHDQERIPLQLVAQAYAIISNYVDIQTAFGNWNVEMSPAQACLVLDGAVGRPSFQIPPSQLQFLIDSRFSVPQIAQLMNVSVSTVRRRMLAYNMSIRATYSTISDEELDRIVSEMQEQFPNWGNRQMYGYLISQNIRIQFSRVRESQSRVDPDGSILRRLSTLRRRTYSVRGPQHLWHVDGHHKLIRSVA